MWELKDVQACGAIQTVTVAYLKTDGQEISTRTEM